jgi:hypothetical protein
MILFVRIRIFATFFTYSYLLTRVKVRGNSGETGEKILCFIHHSIAAARKYRPSYGHTQTLASQLRY